MRTKVLMIDKRHYPCDMIGSGQWITIPEKKKKSPKMTDRRTRDKTDEVKFLEYDRRGEEEANASGCSRAGVIVTSRGPCGRIFYGFGVDAKTREITDFGGGVRARETVTGSALREFAEESLGVFDDACDTSPCARHLCAFNKSMLILFLRIASRVPTAEISINFDKKARGDASAIASPQEVSAIVWLTEKELRDTLRGVSPKYIMYSRVRRLLSACVESLCDFGDRI